jgi:Holliday junction resolvase-like predicted endonuclease
MTPEQERYRSYEVARDYLTTEGIRVLDRYWEGTEGTLELVATEHNVLVVVILRDKPSLALPPKGELKRQRRLAVAWMHAHSVSFPRIRVDVVSVTLLPMGQSNLEHVRAVDGDLY